jgi:hypothetical protein
VYSNEHLYAINDDGSDEDESNLNKHARRQKKKDRLSMLQLIGSVYLSAGGSILVSGASPEPILIKHPRLGQN